MADEMMTPAEYARDLEYRKKVRAEEAADFTPLRHYQVEFETSVSGEQVHAEDVFARDEWAAIARSAWITAIKGYEVINVRSVSMLST
jgi:hypothetical protein